MILIKAGDTLPVVQTRLRFDGAPIPLSESDTVHFVLKDERGRERINAEAEILDHADAAVRYVWRASDTTRPGRYEGRFRVRYANGERLTVPNELYGLQFRIV